MSGMLSMDGLTQMLHAERSKTVYVVLMVLLVLLVLVSYMSTGSLMALWPAVVANGVDRALVDASASGDVSVVGNKDEFKRRRGGRQRFINSAQPYSLEQTNPLLGGAYTSSSASGLSGVSHDVPDKDMFKANPSRARAQANHLKSQQSAFDL